VKLVKFCQEYSLPLILGVLAALLVANLDEHLYHHIIDLQPFGDGVAIFGHKLTLHFLINDIFMVFFFGIAAKEITESILPGGPLNPIRKAINPLLGTLGGVLGPIGVFFLLVFLLYGDQPPERFAGIAHGWGIPTATDIALAWLVARVVFGKGHPAINFLLLLAVADDAIGLGIIAVFYPNPEHPPAPIWLLLTAAGMISAFAMRKAKVRSWLPYVLVGGSLSWVGLVLAALHPALALVFIIPFLPGPRHDTGLFEDTSPPDHAHHSNPLQDFEHQLKLIVDFGMFFFAFANAGVSFSTINPLTWIILASLIVGKTLGITLMSFGGHKLGFSLPNGMALKHLVVAGIVAGLGLTVALFVSGEAFPASSPIGAEFQGPAKMGAVFSAAAAAVAFALGRILRVQKRGHT
jgi:NhaA family Na+:H+ antiporter